MPDEILASFPAEFREGMAARAERLGDRGPSAPEHWEPGLGTGEAHVLITVYAIDNEHLDERREVLRQFGQAHGATTVDQRDARRGAAGRQGPLRLLRRDRAAGRRGQRRRGAARRRPARRRRRLARRRAPASSCTATSTRTAACPTPRPRRFTATGRSRSTASSHTDVAAFRALHGGEGARLSRAAPTCSRPRSSGAGATGRRSCSRPTAPDPDDRRRPRAHQRLLLRRRPGGPALPAGLAHPPRQPARRRGLLQGPA